ncbi:MAG: hypothetical protein ABI382_12105 [Nakamurella sp.]
MELLRFGYCQVMTRRYRVAGDARIGDDSVIHGVELAGPHANAWHEPSAHAANPVMKAQPR